MLNQKINRSTIIEMVEKDQIKDNVPKFGPGDTVVIYNKIIENNKTRIQKFEGIVLRIRGRGISKTFIVRKESNGIWVERNFFINSPMIDKIEVIKQGKVRRAYLTYMRKRTGKSARIAEKKSEKEIANTKIKTDKAIAKKISEKISEKKNAKKISVEPTAKKVEAETKPKVETKQKVEQVKKVEKK